MTKAEVRRKRRQTSQRQGCGLFIKSIRKRDSDLVGMTFFSKSYETYFSLLSPIEVQKKTQIKSNIKKISLPKVT